MSENKERIIAVCAAGVDEEYNEAFLSAFAECAKKLHYKSLFFHSFSPLYDMIPHDKGERKIYDLINFDLIDGLVILSQSVKSAPCIQEIIDRARKKDIPVISIDSPLQFDGCYHIRFNYEKAMEKIVTHVIEEHHAEHINFIAGFKGNEYSEQRLNAYRKVLQAHNIPVEEERIGYGDFWFGPTQKAVEEFITSDLPFPQAIVCANDSMAITAYEYLTKAGYRIPEDVILTGFDGILEALYHIPPIATAKHDITNIANAACKLLHDLYQEIPCENIILVDSLLLMNGTCGCVTNTLSQQNDLIRRLQFKIERGINFDTKQMRMIAGLTEHNSFQELFERLKLYAEDLPNHHFSLCIADNFLTEEEFSDILEESSTRKRSGYSSRMDEMLYRCHDEWMGITDFPTNDLLPHLDDVLTDCSSVIFFPLHVQEQIIGYAAFSYDQELPSMSQYYLFCTNVSLSLEIVKSHRRQQTIIQNLENKYVHDPLTGLLNRRGFYQKVTRVYNHCIEAEQPIMIISIDLNGLKPINDTYGHADGDIAISTIGKALLRAAKNGEVCARFGGDEFVVAGAVSCDEDTQEYINCVKQHMDLFNETSGKPYKISASFGCLAAVPNSSITLDEFIRQADERMYAEKAKHHLSRGR